MALLEYRNTPLTGTDISPAELLQKRLLRNLLPVSEDILNKTPNLNTGVLQNQRNRNRKYYDKTAQKRPSFKEGDTVMIKKEEQMCWIQQEEIVGRANTPRSYLVKDNME